MCDMVPISIDECLDILQKETAESERQLRKRQLEIVMRLKQNNCGLMPDETVLEIANALMTIVRIRLYGPESLLGGTHRLTGSGLREVMNDVCSNS